MRRANSDQRVGGSPGRQSHITLCESQPVNPAVTARTQATEDWLPYLYSPDRDRHGCKQKAHNGEGTDVFCGHKVGRAGKR